MAEKFFKYVIVGGGVSAVSLDHFVISSPISGSDLIFTLILVYCFVQIFICLPFFVIISIILFDFSSIYSYAYELFIHLNCE